MKEHNGKGKGRL